MNGAEKVVETLEKLGCGTVFGIPGIHNLDIYDALIGSSIHHVTARNESGAGFMADGFARSTGKPGVALVITGPGLTNIATAMGEAMHDSVPMLVISSQIPSTVVDQQTGFLHELKNSTTLAHSVAKESRVVRSAEEIEGHLREAYRLTTAGRPGPVHLEISMDVLQSPLDARPEQKLIEQAAEMLNSAGTVAILTGGGSVHAGDELKALAEKLSAPVAHTMAGKGTLDVRHPLSFGNRIHFPEVMSFFESRDIIIAVGTQLSPTDLWEVPLRPSGKLIQIDTDSGAFNKNCLAELGICGDAKKTIAALLPLVKEKSGSSEKETVDTVKRSSRGKVGAITGITERLDLVLETLDVIRKVLPEDGLFFTDMTMPAYVALSEFPAYRPRTFFHPVGFGTLGYALPAGLGAKIADPEKTVVTFSGDGGYQFTMQELAAACEQEVTLPVIIWNNSGFGEIRRTEDIRHPGKRIAVDNRNPDFMKLAEAYRIPGHRVRNGQELEAALRESLERRTPSLIEIDAS